MDIQISSLSKIYKKGALPALDNLDLRISSGTFGLLGPNGAGKTTLIKILTTQMEPTTGEVTIDGRPIDAARGEVRQRLGYLPQHFGAYPNLTAFEFLDYMARLAHIQPGKHRKQVVEQALEEVAHAPNAMMAAEMAVIRLTHVADLPSPEELVRKLQDAPVPPPPGGGNGGGARPAQGGQSMARGTPAPTHPGPSGPSARGSAQPAVAQAENPLAHYATFEQVVELIRTHRDVQMLIEVETTLRLVRYSPGRIEFEPTADARGDLAQRLGQKLQAWTGARWAISIANEGGAPTIAETRDAAALALRQEAEAHPLVRAVFAAFPKAKITEIRSEADRVQHAAEEALAEVEDEWDPFEEE